MERRLSEQRRQEMQDDILAAFARSGFITHAADESNVPYQYHRKWLVSDLVYAAKFDEIQQQTAELRHQSHSDAVKASKERLTPEERSEAARRSHTPESDQKRRESMQRKWDDPEYQERRAEIEAKPETKARRSAAAKEMNNRPERREFQSNFMRDKFANDEEFRRRHSTGLQIAASDPAYAEIRAQAMQRLLDDPRWHDAVSEGTKRHWREDRFYDELYAVGVPLTRHEVQITRLLYEWGIDFRVHVRDFGPEMDIVIPSLMLNIEVDGLSHLKRESLPYDLHHNEHYRALGYTILRIEHAKIDDGSFIPILHRALYLNQR